MLYINAFFNCKRTGHFDIDFNTDSFHDQGMLGNIYNDNKQFKHRVCRKRTLL